MSQKYEYFGKYILLEKLAMGGMAEVFLARSQGASGTGKFVAMKRILPQFTSNKDFSRMFKDEAKICLNLSHSNIVSIFEFGKALGQFYLIMDYVEGRNLRQVLNKMTKSKTKFNTEKIVYIVNAVASGLDYSHRCLDSSTGKPLNITHRDISPQNIMLSFEGDIKIVDFGIAKAETQVENTRAGTIKGKFGYMSPEQAEGQEIDLRTDIFSLGIVLWEMLADERLFIANNEMNTLKKIRECKVPSLKKYNPNIHPELERIVLKTLSKDRNLRYQTAGAFHRDLNRFLNRQYPDFSAQDFSVFIKTLYSDDVFKQRKKLVEYAKIKHQKPNDDTEIIDPNDKFKNNDLGEIDLKDAPADFIDKTKTKPDERTQATKIFMDQNNDYDALDRKALKGVLHKKLKIKNKPSQSLIEQMGLNDKESLGYEDAHFGLGGRESFTSGTNPYVKVKNTGMAQYLIYIILITTAITLAFSSLHQVFPEQMEPLKVSFYKLLGFKSTPLSSNTPKVEVSTQELKPGIEYVYLTVQSKPSGASIYINGKHRERTPAQVKVPFNKAFEIKLKREDYVLYTKQNLIIKNDSGNKFLATLTPAEIGYLSIDVFPPINAKVYLNGNELEGESLPIKNYRVPANTKILVRADNPIKNITNYKSLSLKKGQSKSIIINLDTSKKKRRTPTSK